MRIAASYAPLLYEYLTRRGLDAVALLGPLPPCADGQLPMPLWQSLLQRADALLGEPALGLRIAEGIEPRHFGVVGYAALACATLGEALQRLERYHSLVYDVSPARLHLDAGRMVVEWGTEGGCPGQLVDETGLAALLQLARNMTGQALAVEALDFINPPPADKTPYERFFGGPVRFAQPTTRIVLPLEYLQLPLRQADAALLALLDAQAEGFLRAQPAAAPGRTGPELPAPAGRYPPPVGRGLPARPEPAAQRDRRAARLLRTERLQPRIQAVERTEPAGLAQAWAWVMHRSPGLVPGRTRCPWTGRPDSSPGYGLLRGFS